MVAWGPGLMCPLSTPDPHPGAGGTQERNAAEAHPGGGQCRPDRHGPRGREGRLLREHSQHPRGNSPYCPPALGTGGPASQPLTSPPLGSMPTVCCGFTRVSPCLDLSPPPRDGQWPVDNGHHPGPEPLWGGCSARCVFPEPSSTVWSSCPLRLPW